MSKQAERIAEALKEGKLVVVALNVKRFKPEEQKNIHFEEMRTTTT